MLSLEKLWQGAKDLGDIAVASVGTVTLIIFILVLLGVL